MSTFNVREARKELEFHQDKVAKLEAFIKAYEDLHGDESNAQPTALPQTNGHSASNGGADRKTMKEYLVAVLEGKKRGLYLEEIVERMQKKGWTCRSDNPKPSVYQLIHTMRENAEIVSGDKDGNRTPYILV